MHKTSLATLFTSTAFAVCFMSQSAVANASVPRYTITDLGTRGGWASHAYGINERSQVVGTVDTLKGSHPFLYTNGRMVIVDTIIGNGWAVNHLGQIVGFCQNNLKTVSYQKSNQPTLSRGFTTIGFNALHKIATNKIPDTPLTAVGQGPAKLAFTYTDGNPMALGMLPGGVTSMAEAINDKGQIVGYSNILIAGNQVEHAVLWQNGTVSDLDALSNSRYSYATAINSRGDVTGTRGGRAFYYHAGTMNDIGVLNSDRESFGMGINSQADICGYSDRQAPFFRTAFLYKQGKMQQLGTLGGSRSIAFSVNDHDEAVGMADTREKQPHAVLWDRHGIRDLNGSISPDSKWVLDEARSINNKGQIVGTGEHHGATHAFLLTPIQ